MAAEVYYKLRDLLDSIPNGYPATESGIEIRILEKIFTEEEAALTLRLKMRWETPRAIARRTGLDETFLEKKLIAMSQKGQIWGAVAGPTKIFKLLPFVFGIYEFQVKRMDREFVELMEEYWNSAYVPQQFGTAPAVLRVVPIEREIPDPTAIRPYESIETLINGARAWGVIPCVCKRERRLVDRGCHHEEEVCLSLAPIANYFDNHFLARPISRDEALAILRRCEDAGLVHMTTNVETGHYGICNCCSCCCGLLRAVNEFDQPNAVAVSNFQVRIDESACTACGRCIERCPVHALVVEGAARLTGRCIGCGLCVSTCPPRAMSMEERPAGDRVAVPENEKMWMKWKETARQRLKQTDGTNDEP